ncbi:MAG: DUF4326 domain-containing protein [Rhizobiaceae bacterium]|nr:DUF4326 domain-containing protein [Rhizobiaceae bacterium]MCV0408886.1 DUF4326 domain-containing protein [Rhizobiaceae bacterium]
MTKPVRLQLSRKKGFNLQAMSLATNGLPAVNVARPSRWGNPHDWRDWREEWPFEPNPHDAEISRDDWCKGMAAAAFEDDILDGALKLPLHELRGKNLACWCKTGGWPKSCHADVLLELANRPGGRDG